MDVRESHVTAALDLSSPEAAALVARYAGLARSLAMRFSRSQHDLDDLVQVAMFGLLQALRRFDPDRGFEFSTYAHATISGELKRYRRRTGWMVHVPRRLQEGYLKVAASLEGLTHELQRQPTIEELAARADVSVEEAIEFLEIREAQLPRSIDRPASDGNDGGSRELPQVDDGFMGVEHRELIASVLERLNPREREVVRLRFFENLTQREIAERIGVSQMHVSRMLRLALEKLRVFIAA